jgi:hypothetical protein
MEGGVNKRKDERVVERVNLNIRSSKNIYVNKTHRFQRSDCLFKYLVW